MVKKKGYPYHSSSSSFSASSSSFTKRGGGKEKDTDVKGQWRETRSPVKSGPFPQFLGDAVVQAIDLNLKHKVICYIIPRLPKLLSIGIMFGNPCQPSQQASIYAADG
ncbi:hypothetical protein E2C01_032245 [Portunus trituberculatus]|uniref:Uncharacterized protein n=1 Tax=Portunus trituberculatus TaxID=210409 RepID=A0A5B7EX06_PORTR|nr:hypothetical protein [Portunus trituberculatus]